MAAGKFSMQDSYKHFVSTAPTSHLKDDKASYMEVENTSVSLIFLVDAS